MANKLQLPQPSPGMILHYRVWRRAVNIQVSPDIDKLLQEAFKRGWELAKADAIAKIARL